MFYKVKEKLSIQHAIGAGISVILTITTIAGALYAVDDRWAKASDLQLVELRLDQKIYSDRLHDIQLRIWSLEDRYGSDQKMPKEVKDEYRRLKQEYQSIKLKLEHLYKK